MRGGRGKNAAHLQLAHGRELDETRLRGSGARMADAGVAAKELGGANGNAIESARCMDRRHMPAEAVAQVGRPLG